MSYVLPRLEPIISVRLFEDEGSSLIEKQMSLFVRLVYLYLSL